MGYDLHITRRKHWSDKGNDISAKEWLAFVESESELELEPSQGKYFAVWSGESTLDSPWLKWSKGQIQTKNPDDALIDKMVSIARMLSAKVQGDDGEIYKSAKDAHQQRNLKGYIEYLGRLQRYYTPRLKNWVIKWFYKPKYPAPPFKRGDQVIDKIGAIGIVKSIDRRAYKGSGIVWVDYCGYLAGNPIALNQIKPYSGEENDANFIQKPIITAPQETFLTSVIIFCGKAYTFSYNKEPHIFLPTEPVYETNLDALELSQVLEKVYQAGNPKVPDGGDEVWPIVRNLQLKYTGAKSYRELEAHSLFYLLSWWEDKISVTPTKKGSWNHDLGKEKEFPLGTSMYNIANFILDDALSRPDEVYPPFCKERRSIK